MEHVLIVMGSGKENGKIIPLYYELERQNFSITLCVPKEVDADLQQLLSIFSIKPDVEIHHKPHRPAFDQLHDILGNIRTILDTYKPSLIVVLGNHIHAIATALAAFYQKVPLCHLESGFKTTTTNDYAEMHQRVISLIATYHCASTSAAAAQVIAHGTHRDRVFCTGDLAMDLISSIVEKVGKKEIALSPGMRGHTELISSKQHKDKKIFISLNPECTINLDELCITLKTILDTHEDIVFVTTPDHEIFIEKARRHDLHDHTRFFVAPVLMYQDMIYVLTSAQSVVTDSPSLHEDALCLNKPVVLLRPTTHRVETVWAGLTILAGSHASKLGEAILKSLHSQKNNSAQTLYGKGDTAQKIVQILEATMNPFARGAHMTQR